MAGTYVAIYYHIVFGTKHGERSIEPAWRERLHAYLGGCAAHRDVLMLAVGGVEDHVHVLASAKATLKPADLVQEIKRGSSLWVHNTMMKPHFAWQSGYGLFTIGASQIEALKRYIARQEEHHRTKTFREEYAALLRKYGVTFDPKYLL